jgi:gamma-glutamyltranspeptidase
MPEARTGIMIKVEQVSSERAPQQHLRGQASTRDCDAAVVRGLGYTGGVSGAVSFINRDGEPYLAWGTPGGDQQDQWIPQFFLRHVRVGLNLQESIDAPAWHTEHLPSSFWPWTARPGVVVAEDRVPTETIAGLRDRGHQVEIGPAWSEERLVAASRDKDRMKASANPRSMQGYAAGR